VIRLTPRAEEVLAKAASAARRFDPGATIRITREGDGVRFGFVHDAEDGDVVIEAEDVTMFVEAGLDGVVDITEPHDQPVLRPEGGG
jgi:hypothetical protein